MNHVCSIASPLGPLTIEVAEQGVRRIGFDAAPSAAAGSNHPLLERACRQLEEYFSGSRESFDLPLAPDGTAFQQRVWAALVTIGYGRTCSYAAIAAAVGLPRAVRAVGAANGRNPIAIVIPCHRVIGSNGTLTGYAGGLPRKLALLQLEGAALRV